MINKEIIINKETRAIVNGENGDLFKLGVDSENLQENIVFKFEDEFVNGTARVEIIMQNNTKSYIMIDKVNETYVMPVKSVLTKKGLNKMQLVITQGTNDEEIPIFKSEMFNFFIAESINADTEQPEEYPQWIDKANTTLNEIDNFDIEAIKELNEATITITDRTGTSKSVKVYDGTDGINGKDAKINGVNTLSLKAGTNITLEQEDNELTINAEGGSGGGAVNSVNGMTGDVVIDIPIVPTKVSAFTNDSGYITKNVNDLTYYTKTSDLPTIPTNISAFNNDVGYLTQHQDISGKQDKIDSSHKLSADLVDDTSTTNKFTNATEKATWNAKSDFSGSYTDLTNKPNLNDYQAQYRVNNSTTRFNFDTEKLGFYVFSEESTGFYYKANNYESYTSNTIPLFMFYTKLVSEAVANEKVGTLIYINDTSTSSSANRGQLYKCDIFQTLNEAVYLSNKVSLTGDKKIKVLTNNQQQIDGIKIFNNTPKLSSYSAPTNNEDLVAKKYVDDSIASAITTTLGGSY